MSETSVRRKAGLDRSAGVNRAATPTQPSDPNRRLELLERISNQPTVVMRKMPDLSLASRTPRLTSLPTELFELQHLTELDVSDNDLTVVPPQIRSLRNLVKLNLSKNYLNFLPEQITDLARLTHLAAASCSLDELPMNFANLKKLRELDLSNNELQAFPPSFGLLTSLEVLNIEHNSAKLVFELCSYGKLTRIRALNISRTSIFNIPSGLFTFHELVDLDVQACNLSDIPSDIDRIDRLTRLNMLDNKLRTLPRAIGELKRLQTFQVRLHRLPAAILNLRNLLKFEIYLDDNPIPFEMTSWEKVAEKIMEDLKEDVDENEIDHNDAAQQAVEVARCSKETRALPVLVTQAIKHSDSFFLDNKVVKDFLDEKWYGSAAQQYMKTQPRDDSGERTGFGSYFPLEFLGFAYAAFVPWKSGYPPIAMFFTHFLVYITCLITFTLLVLNYSRTDSAKNYYFSAALEDMFVTADYNQKAFTDIGNMNDFYEWAGDPFMSNVFQDDPELSTVARHDLKVGPVVFRQFRVPAVGCQGPLDSEQLVGNRTCYGGFVASGQDRQPFGPDVNGNSTSQRMFGFTEPTKLSQFTSPLSLVYPIDGGYVAELNSTSPEAFNDTLHSLIANGWIDKGTAAISVEVSVFNPNVNLVALVLLLVETPFTGAWLPSYSLEVFPLVTFSATDTVLVLFLISIGLLMTYELYQIVQHLRKGFKFFLIGYLFDAWNWLDLSSFLATIAVIILDRYTAAVAETLNVDFETNTFRHDCSGCSSLRDFAELKRAQNSVLAFLFIVLWLLLSKFIRIMSFLGIFVLVMIQMFKFLIQFILVYLLVTIAFSGAFMVMLSAEFSQFRTIGQSLFYLVKTTLGGTDWDFFEQVNSVWASVLMVLYLIFAIILMLNLLIALLNSAYEAVTEQSRQQWLLDKATLIMGYQRGFSFEVENDDPLGIKGMFEFITSGSQRAPRGIDVELRGLGAHQPGIPGQADLGDSDQQPLLDDSDGMDVRRSARRRKGVSRYSGFDDDDDDDDVGEHEHSSIGPKLQEILEAVERLMPRFDELQLNVVHRLTGKLESFEGRLQEIERRTSSGDLPQQQTTEQLFSEPPSELNSASGPRPASASALRSRSPQSRASLPPIMGPSSRALHDVLGSSSTPPLERRVTGLPPPVPLMSEASRDTMMADVLRTLRPAPRVSKAQQRKPSNPLFQEERPPEDF